MKTRCPLLPCGDFVVLRADAPVQQVGSIILTQEQPPQRAVVEAVGPDCEHVEQGAHVLFRTWLTEVEVEGVYWLLVREDDVLARIA